MEREPLGAEFPVLGVTCVGPGAGELLHPATVGMVGAGPAAVASGCRAPAA
ncbi:hypothetical protein [Streptomyces chromofuscus]|uniref:hypothetical protein n=1 Tax=Streptomyces chromofuscus TaxID=42881 RepID=UPI001675918B|nr:hypothetical protein [Streptomyces chromofuscus]